LRTDPQSPPHLRGGKSLSEHPRSGLQVSTLHKPADIDGVETYGLDQLRHDPLGVGIVPRDGYRHAVDLAIRQGLVCQNAPVDGIEGFDAAGLTEMGL